MDESKWTKAELPPEIGGEPYEVDVCPGWLTRQPSVIEGAKAYSAMKVGELSTYYPDAENVVLEAAMVANQAFNLKECERIKNGAKKG